MKIKRGLRVRIWVDLIKWEIPWHGIYWIHWSRCMLRCVCLNLLLFKTLHHNNRWTRLHVLQQWLMVVTFLCDFYKAVKKGDAANMKSVVEYVSMGKVDVGGQKGVPFFSIIDWLNNWFFIHTQKPKKGVKLYEVKPITLRERFFEGVAKLSTGDGYSSRSSQRMREFPKFWRKGSSVHRMSSFRFRQWRHWNDRVQWRRQWTSLSYQVRIFSLCMRGLICNTVPICVIG
jgi:hypothetical protein